jgi:hypothetical protein
MEWNTNPHAYKEPLNYPHAQEIMFVVVTKYAPKSTYTPRLNESLITWSDDMLRDVVDEIMESMM